MTNLPYIPTEYNVKPGLKKLEEEKHFIIDDLYSVYRNEKMDARHEKLEKYYIEKPTCPPPPLKPNGHYALMKTITLWMAQTLAKQYKKISFKPEEELYDTEADPDEVHNLAADPEYAEKLKELRAAHEVWKEENGDLGQIPETELIKQLYPPNGKQPTTGDPVIAISDGTANISCPTEGASIAWRYQPEDPKKDPPWKLYTGPITLRDDTPIQAQAIRYGWKKSGVVTEVP